MSVALMIDNPRNEEEDRLYIPVAGEATFEKFWQEGAKQLGLEWVPFFQFGIVIGWERRSIVILELKKVRSWFLMNISDQELAAHLSERVMNILHAIVKIFEDQELRVFIG